MGKQRFFIIGTAAALMLASVQTASAFQSSGPVRVISVAPARSGAATSARDLLAEKLGDQAASSPVAAPDADDARLARQFAPSSGASRVYGDVRVTAYRVANEAVAYALVREARPEPGEEIDIGRGGWSGGESTVFWLGPYAVLVEGPGASRDAIVPALVSRIGSPVASAPLLDHLPRGGRVAGSERYVPSFDALRRVRPDLSDDVFMLGTEGAEAGVAAYEQPGSAPILLTLVEYQTPQLAADAERRLRAAHGALSPEARARRLIKREGNYLVEALNVADEAVARGIVDAVDYAFEVKWLKDPNPLPGFDVAAEGRKVAQVILSSFAIVGIGLLTATCVGIVFGAGMFRHRRRGVGNTFSDAGGMVCLDLDPALPPTAGTRLLGKGDD